MIENAERILLGDSIKQPEMDDEDVEGIEDKASYLYDMTNILNSIKTSQFKEIYTSSIQSIQKLDILIQQEFCINILKKISLKYNYEFPHKFDLVDKSNINMVYEFIAFLEFDSIDFISNMWKYLNVNLRKIDIEKYCRKNALIIIREIEEQIDIRKLNELNRLFLRTYMKDDIIKFIIRITKKNKMLILANIAEGI